MVAHRLSTVVMADEIIVLGDKAANGAISVVERGSHKDLLKKDGFYARLWAIQTRQDSKDNEPTGFLACN